MTTLGGGLDVYQPLRDSHEVRGAKMAYRSSGSSNHRQPNGTLSSSSATGDYSHHSSASTAMQPPVLSTLEASGNENNQRIASSSSSRLVRNNSGGLTERDSSTWTQTGIGQRTPSASSLKGSATSSGRSNSVRSNGSSLDEGNSGDSDTVIIEEKRKRASGDGYTIHRYTRGRLLGKGGFAKVYLCTAMDTGKNYAVKVVPKSNLVKARARQKLQAEIKIHRTLKHKHVCEYKHFFEDRNNCYILLELCHNQSLNELIKRRKRLTEPEAAFFMVQLLKSVRYMHENNVIHRDLKLGNLFLDKHMHIKVGDLGLATRVEDKDEKRKTICGTPNYIAPEVIQSDKSKRGHSFEVDVWSMGVILFTVLVGKPPYEAKDVKATYQRIIANEYSFPSHVRVSDDAMSLIKSMLQSKPIDRPSLDEIQSHPFLSGNTIPISLPSSALHLAPSWRVNEYGDLVCDEEGSSRGSRKPALPRGASGRQPFATRDPNMARSAARAKKEKSERDVIDMQRVVKSALAMTGSAATSVGSSKTSSVASSKTSSSSPAFKIFDETTGIGVAPYVGRAVRPAKQAQPRPTSFVEDALVARTRGLSIADTSPRSASSSSSSAATSVETDAEILQKMVDRLQTVIEITQNRKGSYRLQSPRALSARSGPSKWVLRYVDYTSKYGLGFLLNDGCSGVYFNDSTKTALEADGENFQYIERKKPEEIEASPRGDECSVETHALSSYPENLTKKVTLLKHFRNYLIEQQQKTDDGKDAITPSAGASSDLVFVKKWVRTKHAILFRLSNHTIQVVFYDQTEVLLTPDDRYITYVDKNRKRTTYHFTDELVGSYPEMEKRLKYTKELMLQLISGQRR